MDISISITYGINYYPVATGVHHYYSSSASLLSLYLAKEYTDHDQYTSLYVSYTE